ncbi:unnamed protein product, partial [Didymodactylos carnosus]
ALGYQNRYQEDVKFVHNINKIAALDFIPPCDVSHAYSCLVLDLDDDYQDILNYFEDTYIGRLCPNKTRRQPTFSIEFWNMHTRTTQLSMLKKPDDSFRFLVDYRKLNEVTKKDSYPQPNTEELLQRIGRHSWFTKPIQQADKEKTAFVTQDRLYQFEVLPHGLANAPPTFQRVMNNLLANNRWDWLVLYLDDILIFSHSFDEHMKHLNEALAILHARNFQLNPKKCMIAVQEIEFLSHTVAPTTIKPSIERIKPILDMPEPRTLKQANQFIGKLNWYRRFSPNFAKISAPIHKVTNKTRLRRKDFYWHQEQHDAFLKLKDILTTEPLLLIFPRPTAQFILSTDASGHAVGGTLKQEIDGKIHYNYYLSR